MNAAGVGPVAPSDQTQSPIDLFLIFVGANVVATTFQVGAGLMAAVLYASNFAWIALNNVIAASACVRISAAGIDRTGRDRNGSRIGRHARRLERTASGRARRSRCRAVDAARRCGAHRSVPAPPLVDGTGAHRYVPVDARAGRRCRVPGAAVFFLSTSIGGTVPALMVSMVLYLLLSRREGPAEDPRRRPVEQV